MFGEAMDKSLVSRFFDSRCSYVFASFCLLVCWLVDSKITTELWTAIREMFEEYGRPWDKKQSIRFWKRSGSASGFFSLFYIALKGITSMWLCMLILVCVVSLGEWLHSLADNVHSRLQPKYGFRLTVTSSSFTCVSYAEARNSYRLDVSPSVRPYVRPTVCSSVTRWYCIKTAEHIVMLSSPHHSPFILVLCLSRSSRNSNGVTPCGAAKQNWGLKMSQFSTNNSLYLRNGWRYMRTCCEAFDKHWILFRSM